MAPTYVIADVLSALLNSRIISIRLPAKRRLLLQGFRSIEFIHHDFNNLNFARTRKSGIVKQLGKLSLVVDGTSLGKHPIRVTENAEESSPIPIGDVVVLSEYKVKRIYHKRTW